MDKSLSKTIEETIDVLEKGLGLSSKAKVIAETKNKGRYVVVVNLVQYIQIAHYDLIILIEQMEGASGWRFKLFARLFYLTAYEIIDDLQHLLGNEFRTAITDIPFDSSLLSDFDMNLP